MYLTYVSMNNLEVKVVVMKANKISDENYINNIVDAYKKLGIKTFIILSKVFDDLEAIKKLSKGRINCLLGKSGTFKSSLNNIIDPSYNCVGDYSYALGVVNIKQKNLFFLPCGDC